MTRSRSTLLACALLTLPLAACNKPQGNEAGGAVAELPSPARNATGQDQLRPPATPAVETSSPIETPTPSGFAPLGSDAVKDAIHRALRTGETQRWQDGAYAGYAVPSRTTDAHGCRAVHYTVDQQPDRSYPVITACE